MAIKGKISVSTIKKLKIEDKRLNDTEIAGFHARISPKGAIKYYLYYRLDGKQVNFLIGAASDITPAQARDLAKEKVGLVTQGQDIQEEKKEAKREYLIQKGLKLGAFLEEKYYPFLISRNPKTAKRTYIHITNRFEFLLNKQLNDISAWEIQKWIAEKRKKGRAAATINYSVNTLKGALSRAVDWGLIESHNLKSIKSIKEDNTRIRYLSADEESQLFKAIKERDQLIRDKRISANLHREVRGRDLFPSFEGVRFVDYIEPMILTALNTGLRRGELMSLTWDDVFFQNGYLVVKASNAKSKKVRNVPLNKTVLEALKEWRKQTPLLHYVFVSGEDKPLTDIKKPWLNLVERANLDNLKFHDLRHDFASKLVMAGVDLNTVRELLGHSDLKMTLRYAHLAPEHKSAAVNLIG
ncbi:site-specific integrase [uncultured Vibrio sp.]|uniref:site-specific integrase n=1 Tax=uncultured Vibrio sp. TaxID=114054 RepID=UPI00091C123B|nr:site-specific integrase [uncultured Vibrio sp.]OIQ24883.1 MAG: integrase [Vibrio sp. MedPE-SWchi]